MTSLTHFSNLGRACAKCLPGTAPTDDLSITDIVWVQDWDSCYRQIWSSLLTTSVRHPTIKLEIPVLAALGFGKRKSAMPTRHGSVIDRPEPSGQALRLGLIQCILSPEELEQKDKGTGRIPSAALLPTAVQKWSWCVQHTYGTTLDRQLAYETDAFMEICRHWQTNAIEAFLNKPSHVSGKIKRDAGYLHLLPDSPSSFLSWSGRNACRGGDYAIHEAIFMPMKEN